MLQQTQQLPSSQLLHLLQGPRQRHKGRSHCPGLSLHASDSRSVFGNSSRPDGEKQTRDCTAPFRSDLPWRSDPLWDEEPLCFCQAICATKKNQQHSSANYKLLGSAWQNSSTFTVARWPLLSLAAGRWSTTFSKGECACVTPTCGFKSHFATVTRNSGVSSTTCVTLGALRNVLWMWEGAKTAGYWTRERTVTQRHRPVLARQVFNSHRNRESRLKGRAHVENRVNYARQMRTRMPGNLLLWRH